MPPTTEKQVSPDTIASLNKLDSAVSALSKRVNPEVSTNEILNPPAPVTIPEPEQPAPVSNQMVQSFSKENGQFLADQIAEQKEIRQRQRELQGLLGQESLQELNRQEMERMGVTGFTFNELQDIQMQLAALSEDSLGRQVDITRQGGRTMRGAQLAVSAEQARNNVRSYGLAARAAALRNNIETARSLAAQAVQFAYQDRSLRNQNIMNQISVLQKQVDTKQAELLERDRRKYEEDQRQIVRAETAVDAAIASGFASPKDVDKLIALSGDTDAQRSYAQGIVANAARAAAHLDRLAKEASIAASNRSNATADLQRRQALYELAAMGDPQAIEELGFDPTVALSEEENKVLDKQIENIDDQISQLTDALSNKMGLQASSGEWQFGEATIRGLIPQGGELVQTEEGFEISPLQYGGLFGAVRARQEKSVFLAQMDNILTKEGLQEIGRLSEQGVKLTPITEKELAILFNSASVLNSAAKRDDQGVLQGFRIPDYQVEEESSKMLLALTNLRADIEARKNLPTGTYAELADLYNQTVANP